MNIVRVLVAMGLVATLVAGLCGFLGPWPGDMITPFRLYLLAAALLALVIAVPMRRRWLIGMAGITVLLTGVPIIVRLMERPDLPLTAAGTPLSLVFSNVLCDNREYDKVIALAKAQDSDIFAAAETTPEWLEHLQALKTQYPYSFTPERLGNFGVAIYAKRPFTAYVYRVGRHRMALARADFGDYILYVAHSMPPANSDLADDNEAYLADLAARMAMEHKPVALAGDLNATLWSHDLAPLIRDRMQWPAGSGMAYSWPAPGSLLRIQIDHVLTTHARAGTYSVLPDVGSDHFPVRSEIWF